MSKLPPYISPDKKLNIFEESAKKEEDLAKKRKGSFPGMSSDQRQEERAQFPIEESRGRKAWPADKSAEPAWDEVKEDDELPNSFEKKTEEPSYDPFDDSEQYSDEDLEKSQLKEDEDDLRHTRARIMELEAQADQRKKNHEGSFDDDGNQLSAGRKDFPYSWAKNKGKSRNIALEMIDRISRRSVDHYIKKVSAWTDDELKTRVLKSLNLLKKNQEINMKKKDFYNLVSQIQEQIGYKIDEEDSDVERAA